MFSMFHTFHLNSRHPTPHTHIINIVYMGAKGDWDFRIYDLVKNPEGTDNLTPVVNFSEVRRALYVGAPGIFSDLLRSVQMLKRECDAECNGKPIAPIQSPVKL